MKKRLLSVLLAWSVLMGALPVYALEDTSTAVPAASAQEMATVETADPVQQEPATTQTQQETQDPAAASREDVSQEEVFEEEVTVDTSDAGLPDNEELFALYLQQQMYPDRVPSTMANWGRTEDVLNADELAIYNTLRAYIEKVAKGEASSTEEIPLPFEHTWTYEELGIKDFTDSNFSAAFGEARDKVANLSKVIDCLLVDCPADLYWFDKTTGVKSSYSFFPEDTKITVTGITLKMAVAQAYSDGTTYGVDTAKTGAAQTALTKAQEIVSQNKDKTTYEKLLAYKDAICDLTSYNHEAADTEGTPYGDPWQLIYVFDGDPSTNVVCEGYSKAFQYLCDLSGIPCYTVTGVMVGGTGAGGHMWNIVPLDGKNYLVDVTNCDTGTAGAPDLLFLKGVTGSVKEGYVANGIGHTITYTYDQEIIDLYNTDILTLSDTDYNPDQAVHTHSYDADGFCECGFYQPAELQDGVYQIGNAGNFFWFAALVNGDTTHAEFDARDITADAVLTQDIDLQDKAWTAIGEGGTGSAYAGVFDGQGYSVSSLNPEGYYSSLFGSIDSQGVVENLILAGVTAGSTVTGGIAYDNSGTIRNCGNLADLAPNFSQAGGIVNSNSVLAKIENCYNLGSISSTENAGGIASSNRGIITGCYSMGIIQSSPDSRYVGGITGVSWPNSRVSNCYYLDTTADAGEGEGSFVKGGATPQPQDAFASGEVTYLLNGKNPGEANVWRQNLDNGQTQDERPVLSADHGIVYAVTGGYSNTEEQTPQDQEQAALTVSGWQQKPAYGDVFALSVTGGSGSGALRWSCDGPVKLVEGTDPANVSVQVTGVGDFSVTVTKAGDATYTETSTTLAGTASARALTVESVTAEDKTYDGSASVQVTAAVLATPVTGDDVALDLTALQATVDAADAGAYQAIHLNNLQLTGAAAGNYTIPSSCVVAGNVTIAQAAAPQLSEQTVQYFVTETGEKTLSVAGLMPEDAGTLTYTAGTKQDDNNLVTDWSVAADGTVRYTLSGQGTTGATAVLPVVISSTNYQDATVRVVLTVEALQVPVVSAEAYTKVYDGQPVTVDQLKTTADVPGSWAWEGEAPRNVADSGEKVLVFTPDDTATYTTVELRVRVTITKADAQVTTQPQAVADLTYNGQPQTLITAGTAEGGTIQYALTENGPYSEELPTATDAGAYTVWYKVAGDANHADIAAVALKNAIAKADPTVPTDTLTAAYGDTLSEVALPEGWAWKDAGTSVGNVGDNVFPAVYAGDKNYKDAEADLTVQVLPVSLEGARVTADTDTFVYNGAEQQLTGIRVILPDASGTELQAGTDFTVTDASAKDAGSYQATLQGKGNYTGTLVYGYTIQPKKIAAQVTAEDKVYDGTTDATVTVTADTGVAGESLTITGLKAAFARKDVGENLTVAVDAAGAAWNNGNYVLTFPETVTASIAPAAYTYAGVADQPVKIGNGLDTVNVAATAAGVAGETLRGTVAWYADETHTRQLPADYVFSGQEGEKMTLYWVFTPDPAYTNYSSAPQTGSTVFALDAKAVPQVSALGVTKTYDGKTVTLADLKPKASVPGTWALDAGTPELKNVGEYSVVLHFTPDATRDYTTASIMVTVKVEPRLFTVGLELSSNQITTEENLPTARLVWSGALEGEDMTFDQEATFTGWPESKKAGYYSIHWANCQEMMQSLMAKPAAVNYRFQIGEYALLTVTQATLLPDSDERFRLESTEGLPYVPHVLQEAGFPTSQAVLEEMFKYAVQQLSGVTLQNTVLHDVKLYYSADGGKTWTQATKENFPAEGIRVTLPYPDGTNATDFDFVVTHMLTTGTPGAVETLAVTKAENGLQFTVHSLSPIAISWQKRTEQTAQAEEETTTSGKDSGSSPAATPAPQAAASSGNTPYYTCPACGYHNWTATDEGYRCDHCGYLESVKQLSGYGNVQGIYEPKSGSSAGGGASTIAQTGDDSNPALWGVLLVVSALALGGLTLYRRKRNH